MVRCCVMSYGPDPAPLVVCRRVPSLNRESLGGGGKAEKVDSPGSNSDSGSESGSGSGSDSGSESPSPSPDKSKRPDKSTSARQKRRRYSGVKNVYKTESLGCQNSDTRLYVGGRAFALSSGSPQMGLCLGGAGWKAGDWGIGKAGCEGMLMVRACG
jgi:hypothetical protein